MENMEEDEPELDLHTVMEVDECEESVASYYKEGHVAPHTDDAQSVEGGLPMPLYENGRFKNPWKTWQRPKMHNLFKMLFCNKDKSRIPDKAELDRTLPVLEPDLSDFSRELISGVRHLWIGHSTSLVQLDGVTLLTDPMFSERCSPLQFLGNKRYRSTPCTIESLPKVDFILISNTHYDHLDHGSVVALNERFGETVRWYVPLGLKKWLANCGCRNVVELTWWQTDMFDDDLNVSVVCTPCQHWGKRTTSDENKVLWSSWCVIGPCHSFHFSGDTAYCEGFKQIGSRYGPFTLATLPIGAYGPRDIMKSIHSDPQTAVDIHEDLRSQATIGIHWGTFSLGYEPYLEPRELLDAEIQRRKMKPSAFFTVKHGEVSLVGADGLNDLD